MGKPVALRKLIIELNLSNLAILRDALVNYHKYLTDVKLYENYTVLSKSAIAKRIRYTEDFIDSLEFNDV